jgi:nitronate monooxygenase
MPLLSELGLSVPIVAAPMAGGPTTPELVVAADRAGGIGFLAAGYLSAEALKTKIGAVRRQTSHLGVNLFAPNPVPVDRTAYRAYRERLRADADRFGVELPEDPVEDDDGWRDKVDLLTDAPVPVVSFTFGVPERAVLDALHAAGTVLVQTVTSADEARLAEAAGVDALAVQSSAAGGHWGTFTPSEPPSSHAGLGQLLAEVSAASELPMIAAGGIADAATVRAALTAGAAAVAVGTVLMLSPEAGTSDAHRAALSAGDRITVVTRAFSGRPARGLRNEFIDRYDAVAPLGYPALHHLTSPVRRGAAAAGDPELVHLWAGTGYRAATTDPAETIMRQLAAEL